MKSFLHICVFFIYFLSLIIELNWTISNSISDSMIWSGWWRTHWRVGTTSPLAFISISISLPLSLNRLSLKIMRRANQIITWALSHSTWVEPISFHAPSTISKNLAPDSEALGWCHVADVSKCYVGTTLLHGGEQPGKLSF